MPIHAALRSLDDALLRPCPPLPLEGLRRLAIELCFFTLKEARACLFACVIFAAVLVVPRAGVFGHPARWMACGVAALMYANFFTHHAMPDLRVPLCALALGLYARCDVFFTPRDRERRMPLCVAFVLIGFCIWIAENAGTFPGIWRYPEQLDAWKTVALGKWSSWTMLALLAFTLVSRLEHVEARIELTA